eukprot:5110871-Karenia_brevis.AAC.1
MPGEGPHASVVEGLISFNVAISACEQGGQWQRVSPLPVAMRREGLPLKMISFSAAISALDL